MKNFLIIDRFSDPIERQQAPVLIYIFAAISIGALLAFLLFFAVLGLSVAGLLLMGAAALVSITSAASVWVLRGGHFTAATLLSALGLLAGVSIPIVGFGYPAATSFIVVLVLPVLFIGLATNRRLLLMTAGASTLIASIAWAITPLMAETRARIAPTHDLTAISVGLFLIVLAVVVAIIMLFGSELRQALIAALAREQELEQLRAGLEATVATRTADLQQALGTVERREQQLQQTIQELQSSQETIRELSAPVIPVLPGVLVAPLIGTMDSSRALAFTNNVLRVAEQQHARYVIFDITGVPVVDSRVAQILLQTARALQLLGTHVVVVGVRPEVAQTLVGLGIDLAQLQTFADLQQAITRIVDRS
ncbi:STAS domain-containing protein [Candidatus Viridilinea mediisalina]|uniref:Anti-anti-sigma factor n=1 Tax=Candidatus Viridilinea mediisalina TaxID=2024553 RepID=A0A2A6RE13_9CHLR|nr:STAS domain-containing protein [Candidatus Viridilinea mediisalina]PDW00389.1 anti-anti-sigma factor [Candidatus Viridilinea mediisalina]